jgi:hypothetical protein
MTARIVDQLEFIDVDKCEREGLFCPPDAGDLAFQLGDSGSAQVYAGELVGECPLALRRRRAAIRQRRVAIGLGLIAFCSSCSAIGERRIAVELGLIAFACRRTAVLPGSVAIKRSLASIQRRTPGMGRGFVARVGGAVARIPGHVTPLGNIVPAIGGSIARVAGFVTLLGDIVTAIACLVAMVTRRVAPLCCIPRSIAVHVHRWWFNATAEVPPSTMAL